MIYVCKLFEFLYQVPVLALNSRRAFETLSNFETLWSPCIFWNREEGLEKFGILLEPVKRPIEAD